jgi:hypothetical protein
LSRERKKQKNTESKEDEKEFVADSKLISNLTYRGKGKPGTRRGRRGGSRARGAADGAGELDGGQRSETKYHKFQDHESRCTLDGAVANEKIVYLGLQTWFFAVLPSEPFV